MGNTFDSKSSTTASSTSVSTTTANSSAGFTLDGFLSGLGGLLPGQGQAAATAQPSPPRIVEGAGNYIYKQDADGTITVLQGPKITQPIVHAPGSPKNVAITAEIGPYVSPIPAAPAPAAGGNPLSGLIDTVSGFDPIGAVKDLFGGGETEAPATTAPVTAPGTPAPTTNPAFSDGTRTVEGSTLTVAKTRADMDTDYDLHKNAGAARTGDKDASTFFCSSLSVWTLAASGYDMNEPIRGADGVPFSYTDINAKEQPGTSVTIGMLINGQTEAVTTMSEVERTKRVNGGWVLHVDETNLRSGFKTGIEDGEAAVKGAAGAFEIAGIGAEVAESAQRPGDFAQARWSSRVGGEDTQLGEGHAWQVWSVKVLGSAMFGIEGRSPKPTSGKLDGWHEGVEFVIDDTTDPLLVGEIKATAAERIEANVAGANSGSQSKDKGQNGGVGITKFMPVPDTGGKYKNYVVFYGRLATSKWNGWKPAKAPTDPAQPETAEPSTGGGLLDQARDFFGL